MEDGKRSRELRYCGRGLGHAADMSGTLRGSSTGYDAFVSFLLDTECNERSANASYRPSPTAATLGFPLPAREPQLYEQPRILTSSPSLIQHVRGFADEGVGCWGGTAPEEQRQPSPSEP